MSNAFGRYELTNIAWEPNNDIHSVPHSVSSRSAPAWTLFAPRPKGANLAWPVSRKIVHESLTRCIDDTRGDNYATATIFEKYKTSLRSIIEICDYLGPPLFKKVARCMELFCCALRKNVFLHRANPNVAQKVPCNRTELNTQLFAARQKFRVQHGLFPLGR